MANDMETFAARLATFDLVLHPDRRSSSSKSPKPVSWPHSRPSPAELAHAGFFYNPYETNPDNTTCFLCRRALDGWEEDDNPTTEHLKHAKDCGWAVMMDIQQRSSNPAEIEDPTSEGIAQARQTTFGESWPHDGKKGWLCQSDKMVEGGWYFCPNEESADLASCAYCKLSLDGWEPKDNPFDEHYRRSSDCSFFVFAKPAKGKGSRTKKSRTSKASSRLSTHSTASEMPASDLEDQLEQSVLSQPARTKSTKKSKSKSKSAKSKKDELQETASQMDVDEIDDAEPETSKPKRSTRGRKRSSADLDKDTMSIADGDSVDQPEPPAKKRATKSRPSRARAQSVASTDVPEYESEATHEEEERKTSRGTSKKKESKGRKASVASSTSKAASKSRIPRDSEIEAAIEAGLEAEEPQIMEIEEAESEKTASKPSSKKKSKSKKAAKKDPEPSNDVINHLTEEESPAISSTDVDQEMFDNEEVARQEERNSAEAKSKRRSSKTALDHPEVTEIDTQSQVQDKDEDDRRHHESFVSVEILSKPLAQYLEVEPNDKDSKKAKKKTSSEKTKKSKKAEKAEKADKEQTEKVEEAKKAEKKPEKRQSEARETPEEQLVPAPQMDTPEPSKQEQSQEESSRRRSSKVPPKTTERYSDIFQDKQYAKSLAESDASPEKPRRSDKQREEDGPVSPLPPASRGTPSLSPQSSDAENHPPSMKPPAHRTQLSSPPKKAAVRIPLAMSTPSPSKRNASAGRLQTSHPWIPVEIDEILLASASDKENVDLHGALNAINGELASPEKKMNVEEWIMWTAKNGEERLKRECERLVGQFEREGARAIRALEGIECID
ncbi:hypothetical protein BDW59DRAFT_98175 [Aspergillus cavernicola]|uniref:Chromosome segregation protein BIR1 n=1 Tax=Aspergillus cavernicola TaxID=176166 RepID=A0ABR4I6I7_9EURO